MNAIVPLNVAAIRVSPTDSSNVVPSFKGRVADFDNMPYGQPSSAGLTSTGDAIVQLLESPDSALAPLYTGIHLHWELPDYFRKGIQPIGGTNIVFPQVPNRWLVVRYLSIYDTNSNTWGPVSNHSWIVESDYISMQQLKDADGVTRPSVPVPLPVNPAFGSSNQPYRFMGRVADAAEWPKTTPGDTYLHDFTDEDGQPYYLTSIGFLGPGFSSYYPDCCSVFGFMDRFLDNPTISNSFTSKGSDTNIQFKASYQVMGWIDGGSDPLDGLAEQVTSQYNDYVANCKQQNVPVVQTPADIFNSIALQNFKWQFNTADITYSIDDNNHITALDLPAKTICSGTAQEIVWNMLESPGSSGFLGDPETPTKPGVWTDNDLEVAVGNTAVDALSALLKYDSGNTDDDPDLLKNYEYLLDALQLGILKNLETEGNNIIALEEALHSNGFAREQGGLLWVVRQKPTTPTGPVNPNNEITLPLTIAEKLSQLNQAQKNYDMGRSALSVMRRQLYMDWYRYIKLYAGNDKSPNITANDLTNYLTTGASSELSTVINKGNEVGIVSYITDPDGSGAVIDIKMPAGSNATAAYALWNELDAFKKDLTDHPDWQLMAAPAPNYWLPTDPVAVMKGSRLEPVRRNGIAANLPVRLSTELTDRLVINYDEQDYTVLASAIKAMAMVNDNIPFKDDFSLLAGEACLLIPSLANAVATTLANIGGKDNPAITHFADFVTALTNIQGGTSGLEGGNPFTGLYNMIRQEGYKAVANTMQQVQKPLTVSITFTNAVANGWLPNAVQWNTQLQLPEFSANRYDPFLPVSLIWQLTLDPLQKEQDSLNYSSTNVTDYFQLNDDGIDYSYQTDKLPITTGNAVSYSSASTMSKKATFSIVSQINNYTSNYPDDPAYNTLTEIAKRYANQRILSQTMSGLNAEQLLTYYIPQISVENLTMPEGRDTVTKSIKNAALTGNQGDNWYDYAFNAQAPIPGGTKALGNFGPLRSGFVALQSLEVVDVFGQRMQLNTPTRNDDGSLKVTAAMTLAPMQDDKANANKIYLPPRILAPTRLWFRWLSAMHNNEVSGINTDFVEMNSHPATSPVCGWVMPNHLDNNLFFYNADGVPVGSFGIEHGKLQYRTRAGNILNPGDVLATDIGAYGDTNPPVNIHLAQFMWYINNKSGDGAANGIFLEDMMQAILNSDTFINPAEYAQDASLAVLVGRPLAITRSVISMETAGGLLPLNQADTSATNPSTPWAVNVKTGVTDYTTRQTNGAANIGNVQFPLRLGDLSNIDDGLIGYIIEQPGTDPYGKSDFFAPAANASHHNGVTIPPANNIQLTLNAAPVTVTILMDPRAAVHATTGVLPVEELTIPDNQYSNTLNNLQVTFFTMPVLQKRQGLTVPLPSQNGYVWRWINPGPQPQVPLAANAANSNAGWDYSPQTLLEGWLNLVPDPNKAPDKKNKTHINNN
jgi:hypothetical protein